MGRINVSMIPPVVSICVLTHNRIQLSRKYIPQMVIRAGKIPFELLVCDNGSTDGTVKWLQAVGKRFGVRTTRIYLEKNIGLEAFNVMAEQSQGKYLLKVDDDIEVPVGFAKRIVDAYESVDNDKLMFLSWDMAWDRYSTYATRFGMNLYQKPQGRIFRLNETEQVLINYSPDVHTVNGACRLSPKRGFLALGGHPKGVVYGSDRPMSQRLAKAGYWGGYINSPDLIYHRAKNESKEYTKFKTSMLERSKYAT